MLINAVKTPKFREVVKKNIVLVADREGFEKLTLAT